MESNYFSWPDGFGLGGGEEDLGGAVLCVGGAVFVCVGGGIVVLGGVVVCICEVCASPPEPPAVPWFRLEWLAVGVDDVLRRFPVGRPDWESRDTFA